MICTSAFSTGNDYGHVRLTIHCKMPYEMSELIQAQGRAGRDGKHAKCIVIPNVTRPKLRLDEDMEIDHKGQEYVMKYIYGEEKECLRFGSTYYIDGKGMKCDEDKDNMWCSRCKGKLIMSDWLRELTCVYRRQRKDRANNEEV